MTCAYPIKVSMDVVITIFSQVYYTLAIALFNSTESGDVCTA